MNKRIIVLIALVVAVFAVPASAETLEVRGTVVDLDYDGAQNMELVWDATNFGAFWCDLDDDLMTEELTIAAGTLSYLDRTIDEDCLRYSTTPVYQVYELYENEGLTVDGDTGYYPEGWMAEMYVAINGKADTLCELLVEFEDDDNKTLILGENWSLGGGFSLVVSDIDLEGTKIRFYLRKDGLELDNKTVSVGEVYTYTVDLAGEYDVPVFSCYVNAIIKETNTTQVKYVFLIDDDVLEIDSGDEFGIMEATASSNYINLSNKEDTIDLSAGNTEHIMGNMYFRTADNDGTGEDQRLRFYPFVEYTESGTYEIRGNVIDIAGTQTMKLEWNAANFGAFWYDLDDDLMTESFWIEANSLNGIIDDRSVDKMDLSYVTHPVPQTYQLWEDEGLLLESGVDDRTHYYIECWMGEKYVAIDGNADRLTRLLVEFEDDDTETLYVGDEWNLSGGFTLELIGVDDTGKKATLRLSKNGVPVEGGLKCINTGSVDKQDCVYTYTADIGGVDNIPIFSCYVDSIFKGDVSYVQLKYAFLIDDDVLEIETSQTYGAMKVKTASSSEVVLKNDGTAIDLDPGTTTNITDSMYFKTADDPNAIRFYPFVECTIGGEEPAPSPATIPANDTDGDGVPDAWDEEADTPAGYWVNSDGIGRRWGDMNGDGELTSVDALMILQAAVGTIEL